MRLFEMSRFVTLLGAVGLMAAACTKPDTVDSDKKSSAQASFVIDRAGGSGALSTLNTKSTWDVPLSAHYSFYVCLNQRASGDKIKGQKFLIENPLTQTRIEPEGPTDNNGCLKWKEEISFNHFAKRSYRIPVTRKVIGQGVNTGSRELNLAVNPWALGSQKRDSGEDVVFLQNVTLPTHQLVAPQDAMKALSGEHSGAAELWVQSVSVRSLKRQDFDDGIVLDLTLSMNPRVKMWNLNGELGYQNITSGEFDVIAHLVAVDVGSGQNKKVILTSGEVTGQGLVRDGQLTASIRTSLEKRVNSGNLELVLKLIPRGLAGRSLKEFEGIFELGRSNALSGNSSGVLAQACREEKPSCQMTSYLAQAENFETLKNQGYAFKNDPFIFGTLKPRFASVLPGETATRRTVAYTASTCITDRFTGERVADMPFVIEYLDENDKPIPDEVYRKSSDETGCLSWDAKIFHKYYEPEELFWKRVRISRENGTSRILRFALNPWDDKFTFGWDEREFSKEFIQSVQSRKKIRSRFFLDSFGYHTVRFLYEIDRFMELEVKKTILIDLRPRVLRYSGIVNARKQTEPLRDGFYLLKVGIQKDYLDTAERGVVLQGPIRPNQTPAQGAAVANAMKDVPKREFITTRTALVRVVDGHMIHPLELTMRDLRLMRTRSNFMIQLETVDERLLQTNQVLREMFQKELEKMGQRREEFSNMTPEEVQTKLAERASELKGKLENAFFYIRERLQSESPIIDKFELEPNLLEPIKQALGVNDFTEMNSPSDDDMDLNLFIEKDSGLERRSFVGPVIFLSNAYSDSVRATDNLDEAKCPVPQLTTPAAGSGPAELQSPFKAEEWALFRQAEEKATSQRQNNAYRFSRYFGALTHLCHKNVDDLIERERVARGMYEEHMPAVASIFNFVSTYNLDFLSLRNEDLWRIRPDCQGTSLKECAQPVRSNVTPANTVTMLEQRFKQFRPYMRGYGRTSGSELRETSWTESDLDRLFFGEDSKDQAFGLCSLMASLTAERLKKVSSAQRHSGWISRTLGDIGNAEESIARQVFLACATEAGRKRPTILVDERLRVYETGEYTFQGGLQVNLNVGDSFSVNRADSRNGSIGLDDAIVVAGTGIGFLMGGPPGGVIGAGVGALSSFFLKAIKPLKLSMGNSLSSSDGTSVSQSTYLVSQIAKFNVELKKYERCRILKFDGDFTDSLSSRLSLSPQAKRLLARGLFVCQGALNDKSNRPLSVEETYFYFTQHFTEGDMLDQADLYNHPWLLSLRGVREFAVFADSIKAQEVVSLGNFGGGLVNPQSRGLAWPLGHMAKTYRQILPSFPGLYTVLKPGEHITEPAEANANGQGQLDPRLFQPGVPMPMTDSDINAEIKCTLGSNGRCQEKTTR
jgi:hypothetical protein